MQINSLQRDISTLSFLLKLDLEVSLVHIQNLMQFVLLILLSVAYTLYFR